MVRSSQPPGAWRSADEALGEARLAVETAKADQDLLLAHLAELTALEPQAGEEARLAAARTDMQKGEKLLISRNCGTCGKARLPLACCAWRRGGSTASRLNSCWPRRWARSTGR